MYLKAKHCELVLKQANNKQKVVNKDCKRNK